MEQKPADDAKDDPPQEAITRPATPLRDVRLVSKERELLRTPLLDLGGPKWTVGDAFQGLQIFGSTGSGKSSGSGRTVARALLGSGFGGLVLCAKSDEPDQWRAYLKEFGCGQRLREFSPVPGASFNFLNYEYNREGGELTHDVVSLFLSAISSDRGSHPNTDPYWGEALREMLTHAVDLVAMGTKGEHGHSRVTLHDLLRVVRSAPQSPAEEASPSWKGSGSRCWELIQAADRLVDSEQGHGEKRLSDERSRDLADTFDYWLSDFPRLTDRVRTIIVSSFTSKVYGLLRSPLCDLLCEGSSDEFYPERSFEGDVILLNLPLKDFGEVGRFVQVLYKTVWQRAAERRLRLFSQQRSGHDLTPDEAGRTRPVFLWADESQYFVGGEDARFQQTARSARVATVYLTQNLPNYYAMLADRHSTAATDSLVGNLQTKILHANGDPTTNEWAERLFGKHWIEHISRARGFGDSASASGDVTVSSSTQVNVGWHYGPVVEGRVFSTLATGGDRFENRVQGYLYQAGRPWRLDSDGRAVNVLPVTFCQEGVERDPGTV